MLLNFNLKYSLYNVQSMWLMNKHWFKYINKEDYTEIYLLCKIIFLWLGYRHIDLPLYMKRCCADSAKKGFKRFLFCLFWFWLSRLDCECFCVPFVYIMFLSIKIVFIIIINVFITFIAILFIKIRNESIEP